MSDNSLTAEPAEQTELAEVGDTEVNANLSLTPDEDEPDTGGEEESGDVTKARKDAAKYRARLRETETERDQLRDQLAAQRRAIVDWRAAATHGGVDSALLDAGGIDIDSLLDDAGQLDMTAIDEFIDATAKRFKIARGFTPNRAQGQAGNGGDVAPKPSLADVFRR
jgi:hypothetical protein